MRFKELRLLCVLLVCMSTILAQPPDRILPSGKTFGDNERNVANSLLYGHNRFRNKAPFAVQDSVVRFFLRGRHEARHVFLAGDFTGWSPTAMAMIKIDSGWTAGVKLKPGKWYYKFVIDGNWEIDADNLRDENDGNGSVNSVFFVPNSAFTLPGSPKAKNVYLAGSFNNWRPDELKMLQTAEGWELPLYLSEGMHSYRFVVDGNWFDDPKNNSKVSNAPGSPPVVYIGRPDLSRTLSNQQKAATAARQSGNKNRIADALVDLGQAYNALSDQTNALRCFQEALHLYEGLKNINGIGDVCVNLAETYRSQSNFPQVLAYLQKARTAYEKEAHEIGLAKTFRLLGYYYLNLPHFQTAAPYFQKSLRLYERRQDQTAIGNVLSDLGQAHLLLRDTVESLHYLQKALQQSEQTGNLQGVAKNLWILGDYYFRIQADIPLALEHFQKALRYFEETNNRGRVAELLVNIADVYNYTPDHVLKKGGINPAGKYAISIAHYKNALEIFKELRPESELLAPLIVLSDLYEKTGQYDSAYRYYKYYAWVREKSINVEKQKEIARLEIKYESQQTEDSLQLAKQLTDEKLQTQLLLAQHQQRLLALSNREKDLQHLAYLKTQSDLQAEQLAKQQKAKQLTLAEQEKALQAAQVKTLMQEKAINQLSRQRQWLYSIGIFAMLALSSLYFLHRSRLRSLRLESELAQEKAAQKQRETDFQRKLADVSLSALRSQMNPHFIFNCLNSIKLYTVQNDTAAASEYLTKFSRLIRLVLEHSRSERITLASELTALELYIQMEAMRFKEKLRYSIAVAANVETDYIEMPPLLLQPYVENAIWHGLMYKEAGGRIDIDVALTKGDSLLQINITDNGIGRVQAAALRSKTATKHKSYGMKATSERIALINQIYKTGAEVAVHDLVGENRAPAGTQVTLQIPIS